MKNILIVFMSALLLSACEKENTFSYLIKHPPVLRQAVMQCQLATDSAGKNAYCQHVMAIAERFDEITNREMQDAQELGEYVLQTQSACVAAKLTWESSDKALRALNAKQATPEEISIAQKTAEKNKQAYEAKCEELQILYTVIGQNSPE